MKAYLRVLSLLLSLLLTVSLLPAAGSADAAALSSANPLPPQESEPVVTEIRVNRTPYRYTYVQYQDELDVTGGLLAIYGSIETDSPEDLSPRAATFTGPAEDGADGIIVLLDYVDMEPEWVSGFDNTVLGVQTLTVTYLGFTATFEINVVAEAPEEELVEIWVFKPPTKLNYQVGTTELNPAGGELMLRYSDQNRAVIPMTQEMIDPSSFSTAEPGFQRVRILYGGLSAIFMINVYGEDFATGIQLRQLPDKLRYVEAKEELDVSGGILTVTYQYADTPEDLPLEPEWVSGFDSETAGEQVLTVEYRGFSTTYSVTVEHDFLEQTVLPTCTEPGSVSRACQACGYSEGPSAIPALGHAWGTPEYLWSEDLTEVTASCVCGRDASHILTETVQTELTVETPPTYLESGAGVRTASFAADAFSPQSRSVTIDPLPLPCDGGPLCPGAVFTDMPKKSNWAHDAIDWAYVNGITDGVTKTSFAPRKACIRAQVVTFLWRAAGSPQPEQIDNPFTDLKTGSYYYTAVLWAVEQGITAGTSPTTFSPGKTCTRGQFVTFLWRFAGCPEPETETCPFTDVKAKAFYYKAVLWASETGVTDGTSPTTFSPGKSCTRAHVVTFLYRALAGESSES